MRTEHSTFKPSLNLLDATMIVAGSMIGSGIFIVSADMARNVGGTGCLIFAWLLTGFLTIAAAVSYGELSAMFPKAGGQYVYLREAFNPLVGFLYGWSFFAVIQTGTIAAVGVAFSKFTAYLIPEVSEDKNKPGKLKHNYSGKAGGGGADIKISSEFGNVVLGHNLEMDLKENKKTTTRI